MNCAGDGETCQILCLTPTSCQNSTLDCGNSSSCIIECNGKFSCRETTIYGNDTSNLTVVSNTNHALILFDIFCPNSISGNNCEINCEDSIHSCYCGWIYTLEGWNDVTFSSNSNVSTNNSNVSIAFDQTGIFYGDGFENSCVYDYQKNICTKNESNTCSVIETTTSGLVQSSQETTHPNNTDANPNTNTSNQNGNSSDGTLICKYFFVLFCFNSIYICWNCIVFVVVVDGLYICL